MRSFLFLVLAGASQVAMAGLPCRGGHCPAAKRAEPVAPPVAAEAATVVVEAAGDHNEHHQAVAGRRLFRRHGPACDHRRFWVRRRNR